MPTLVNLKPFWLEFPYSHLVEKPIFNISVMPGGFKPVKRFAAAQISVNCPKFIVNVF
jgi:hypothetical protein